MRKITAVICLLALLLCGCGGGQKSEETTLTGMVMSVEGTKLQLFETDGTQTWPSRGNGQSGGESSGASQGGFGNFGNWGEGQMPTFPEGEMPSFGNGERPSFSGGERPSGSKGERPSMQDGQMPTMPEGEMPTFPEGQMPTFPEGEMPTMPEGGFGNRGENGGGNWQGGDSQIETTTIDIADAHITLEIEGGKATGSLEDITRGAFVTITLVDGKATRVVVAQNSGFSGMGGFGGFGGQGGFGGGKGQGGNRPGGQQTPESTTPTNNT